jgi:hypothetical protein
MWHSSDKSRDIIVRQPHFLKITKVIKEPDHWWESRKELSLILPINTGKITQEKYLEELTKIKFILTEHTKKELEQLKLTGGFEIHDKYLKELVPDQMLKIESLGTVQKTLSRDSATGIADRFIGMECRLHAVIDPMVLPTIRGRILNAMVIRCEDLTESTHTFSKGGALFTEVFHPMLFDTLTNVPASWLLLGYPIIVDVWA